jgi:hypothetical protein
MHGWRLEQTSYRAGLLAQTWADDLRWLFVRAAVSGTRPLRSVPLPQHEWAALLRVVEAERVSGFLAEATVEDLPVTRQQREQALEAHRIAVMTDLRIEQAVSKLARLFAEDGIRWVLIKGLAAANLLYGDPALRSTGDVDVLVHPADFERAVSAIRARGGSTWEYLAHGVAAEAAAAARTFIHPTGVELDVHRDVRGHAGRYTLPPELFFDETKIIDLRGTQTPAPSLRALLLHAMLHLSKGGPNAFGRLSTLADLLWARTHHAGSYRAALELARETGCVTPALWADRTLTTWFQAPLVRAEDAGWQEEARLRAFDRAVASPFVAGHLHRFVGPHRLRRAWEAAFPAPGFREQHQRSGFRQLRHTVVRLLTGREPS